MIILLIIAAAVAIALSAIVDPCSLNSLTTQSKCFNCLSRSEKAMAINYFLALALKSFGGQDLTNLNTLRSFVACYACESTFVLDSFDVAVAQNLAITAGANANITIAQLRAAIKCRTCAPDPKSTKAAETVLRCKLNSYLATPPGPI